MNKHINEVFSAPADWAKWFDLKQQEALKWEKELINIFQTIEEASEFIRENGSSFVRSVYEDLLRNLPYKLRMSVISNDKLSYPSYYYSLSNFLEVAKLFPVIQWPKFMKHVILYKQEEFKKFYNIYKNEYLDLRIQQEIREIADSEGKSELITNASNAIKRLINYLTWVVKFNNAFESYKDTISRRIESYYSNKEQHPKLKEIDVFYHATTNLKAILSEGFRANFGKGLGGHTDGGISFTSSLDVAKNIAYSLRELVKISRGELKFKEILSWAEKEGMDLSKIPAYNLYINNFKKFLEKEIENTFEFYRYYLALSKERYDPVFFGIDIKDYREMDYRNIGVVACWIETSKLIKYLHSMEEYRFPVDAIKRIKEIKID